MSDSYANSNPTRSSSKRDPKATLMACRLQKIVWWHSFHWDLTGLYCSLFKYQLFHCTRFLHALASMCYSIKVVARMHNQGPWSTLAIREFWNLKFIRLIYIRRPLFIVTSLTDVTWPRELSDGWEKKRRSEIYSTFLQKYCADGWKFNVRKDNNNRQLITEISNALVQ